MFKNSADIKKHHKRFITEVTEKEVVWGLHSTDGWASSTANNYDDSNGNPAEIICFWSDEKRARVCQKKYWPNYQPKSIKLNDFIENWLTGMDNERSIVGTNFDWKLFGFEAEPLMVMIELFDHLKKSGKALQFSKYENHDEFETLVRDIFQQYQN